ncbi:MAG TPA: alpha-L-arabinofuranosidase C-terminal domain-containing protein [Bacteroidota bacterium]|nr:alpha-L-arabinofuranosidase C-terminal domain-containing protein [Bacteroidota bacterium]
MKKIFVLIPLLIATYLTISFSQTAKIKIDIDRTTGAIDPKIYGVFMEPIHFSGKRMGLPDSVSFNTLYGNLYDPSSPLANQDGFRKDYIDAMKELQIADMRWPGGNYVMGYNWQDGIGPKEQRPSRINLAWGGTDNNHVGTDEWFALNKSIGSENVVCVNLGLDNIMNACYWVEYCNYPKGTYFSDLRAKNGHPEPYNAKIWDLGNEVDGTPWELGHKTVDEYIRIAQEAIKAMRSVDKSIKLVASGSSNIDPTNQWIDWNRKVLAALGDSIDYLSIHRYWEGFSRSYYDVMGAGAMDFEEKIRVTADEIDAVKVLDRQKKQIYISVDEWGSFGNNMQSVLPIAQCLNSFIRHADVVKMANFTMMTSLVGSDREKGTFKTPLFYTFKLFSNNCRGNAVDTYVQCDTFNTEQYKSIPYLDVTSVYSKETKTLYINVVNRHKDDAIKAEILSTSGKFSGKAEVSVVNRDDIKEMFNFDQQDQYKPVVKEVNIDGNKFSYSFPAHSFTQIKVRVKE